MRLLAIAVSLPLVLFGQNDAALATALNFERDAVLAGWSGTAGQAFLDREVRHGGNAALRLDRAASSAGQFANVGRSLPVDFGGSSITLRGFLKTDGVTGYAGFWLREDGEAGMLLLDNMSGQEVKGTHDWREYSVTLPLRSETTTLVFGVLSAGAGKTWADDLQLLVDGKPVWEATKIPQPKLTEDHEFDAGSQVTLAALTQIQIDNLTTLGKVWGFLKYHDPRVVSGQFHWDYELFRVLPKVLAATSRQQADAAMLEWIGSASACTQCRALNSRELHLAPDNGWIRDAASLGQELSDRLVQIEHNRPVGEIAQFYLTQSPGVGNPVFRNEPAYAPVRLPDAGFQLLAVYRLWNIIAYWFPYRDVLPEKWDDVLREFIPRVALAKSRDGYQLQLMAMIAKISDTHANLWSSLAVRPPVGACVAPAALRFVEDRATVWLSFTPDLKPGDVVRAINGTTVEKMIPELLPYYAASNEPTRMRDIAAGLTKGPCEPVEFGIQRGETALDLALPRVAPNTLPTERWHDQPGPTFRLLSPEVAYLKLSSVKIAEIPNYLRDAEGTKGMIVDIRNYPSEFVVFALGQHLVQQRTPFVRFTTGDPQNPGAFVWRGDPLELVPEAPRYQGKVVVLVDELTQSQAEYTTMAFRAAGATVIGSTTAGADGNVSEIPLPGGLRTMISGIGVFYPDKRPTQRIGIVPDIELKPTIAGIRAGRDELVDAAMRLITGSGN